MTTIAYRDGVLAADTRCTIGNTVLPEEMRKVFLLESGALFGGAGSAEQLDTLYHALTHTHPTPHLKKTEALLVHPDGSVFIYEGTRWVKCGRAPYHALGTGADAALAAMWMGASATKAVECGIAHDKNSGGPIVAVRLKGKR